MNTQSFSNVFFGAQGLVSRPDKALRLTIALWFCIAMVGQQIFAVYILVRYGLPVIDGQYENMNLSTHIKGYVPGDSAGNTMLYLHLIPAALLSFSGILQLWPALRSRFPVLHRWNGRMFIFLGISGAISGLYLTWLRDTRLSDFGAMGITINGILIIVFGHLTWRYAVQRQFAIHQRLAVHTFFLVNGVWTFRLYLIGWYMLNPGGYGNNNTLDGPADIAISFACYLIPMVLTELVFWGLKQRDRAKQWFVVSLAAFGCAITAIGVFANVIMIWFPRMSTHLSAFGG